jgi:hypothetical protein
MEDKDKIWSNKGLIDQYGSTSGRNISNVNYCFFLHLGKETYNINGKRDIVTLMVKEILFRPLRFP